MPQALHYFASAVRRKKKSFKSSGETVAQQSERLASVFDRLPVEIALRIIGFLPASAAVCLALTCHFAKEIVGEEPFESLRKSDKGLDQSDRDGVKDLRLFRSLLGRDLATWGKQPPKKTSARVPFPYHDGGKAC